MRLPRLVRRRELWVPTIAGWALLLLLAAGSGWLAAHALYGFLAPNEPVDRGLLVVEGWVNDATLAEAARLWRAGGYSRLVTTGGPVERYSSVFPFANYAEQAAESLVALGIPAAEIAVVAAPSSDRERTFMSAVALREWLARNRIDASTLDVITEGPHGRRTWLLYRDAFGANVTIGIRSVMSTELYSPAAWWKSSAGAKDVVTEAIAWLWVKCFFHPIPSISPAESDLDWRGACRVGTALARVARIGRTTLNCDSAGPFASTRRRLPALACRMHLRPPTV